MLSPQILRIQMFLPLLLIALAGYFFIQLALFKHLLRTRRGRRPSIRKRLFGWLLQFATGVGMGFGIILLALLVPLLAGQYRVAFLTMPGGSLGISQAAPSPSLSTTNALAILAVQSLAEEAYYRGVWMLGIVLLLGFLSRPVLGKQAFLSLPFQLILWGNAIVLSAALFAFQHAGNPNVSPLALTNIFLAGALFGLLLAATRSLALIWGLHFAWNSLLVLLGLPVSGYRIALHQHLINLTARSSGITTGGAFGPEASIPLTVVLIIVIAAVARMLPTRTKDFLTQVKMPPAANPPAEADSPETSAEK